MNLVDNKRLFSLTPVVESEPTSRQSKYPMVSVGDIGSVGEYIIVPYNLTQDITGYKHRLMFQFNITFSSDFYIIDAATLARFSTSLLLGGCLCVKYRVGTTVFRYKILDSHGQNDNWSGFTRYTNQLIKKNFCIEFWQDESIFARGITQSFNLQTSNIIQPTTTDQDNTIDDIAGTALGIDDLGVPFPIVYPIDFSNQAFLDNII